MKLVETTQKNRTFELRDLSFKELATISWALGKTCRADRKDVGVLENIDDLYCQMREIVGYAPYGQ